MTDRDVRYRIELTPRARRDINAFARYCRSHSMGFWREHSLRLADAIEVRIAETPFTWSFFYLTGAPYRAYLFEAGERTKYWLIYKVDERARMVTLVRMWNAARNPTRFRA